MEPKKKGFMVRLVSHVAENGVCQYESGTSFGPANDCT